MVLKCAFPHKKQIKHIFKGKQHQQKHYDIKHLRDDKSVADKYSNKLEELLITTGVYDSVNSIDKSIAESIQNATESTVPIKTKVTDT